LRDSLLAASVDIVLVDLVPPGHSSPVDFVIDVIYGSARLPLFHAKDGKTWFVPSTDQPDRATVQAALTTLTFIVIRMAESWHGISRPRTSFSNDVLDAMNKAPFANASFVASADARFSPDDSLSSPLITSGIGFLAQIRDAFDGEQRMNVWGAIDAAALKVIGRVEIIHLVNAQSPLASSAFGVTLDVDGFDRFQAMHFFRSRGVGEPRIFYPR
jgi:hypothetical protein